MFVYFLLLIWRWEIVGERFLIKSEREWQKSCCFFSYFFYTFEKKVPKIVLFENIFFFFLGYECWHWRNIKPVFIICNIREKHFTELKISSFDIFFWKKETKKWFLFSKKWIPPNNPDPTTLGPDHRWVLDSFHHRRHLRRQSHQVSISLTFYVQLLRS